MQVSKEFPNNCSSVSGNLYFEQSWYLNSAPTLPLSRFILLLYIYNTVSPFALHIVAVPYWLPHLTASWNRTKPCTVCFWHHNKHIYVAVKLFFAQCNVVLLCIITTSLIMFDHMCTLHSLLTIKWVGYANPHIPSQTPRKNKLAT